MLNKYFFKGIIFVTNTNIKHEFTLTYKIREKKIFNMNFGIREISDKMVKKVVCYAYDFANNYGFQMPIDYILDDFDICVDEIEVSNKIYVEYIDSNLLKKQNFEVIWDNYMKALGKGNF